MKNYSISELVNSKGLLTCPVCKKEFKPNDNTKYIAAGGYTCSWKCFMTVVNKIEEKKKISQEEKKKGNKK